MAKTRVTLDFSDEGKAQAFVDWVNGEPSRVATLRWEKYDDRAYDYIEIIEGPFESSAEVGFRGPAFDEPI